MFATPSYHNVSAPLDELCDTLQDAEGLVSKFGHGDGYKRKTRVKIESEDMVITRPNRLGHAL